MNGIILYEGPSAMKITLTVNRPGFLPDPENVWTFDDLRDARDALEWEIGTTAENLTDDDPSEGPGWTYSDAMLEARSAVVGSVVAFGGYVHALS